MIDKITNAIKKFFKNKYAFYKNIVYLKYARFKSEPRRLAKLVSTRKQEKAAEYVNVIFQTGFPDEENVASGQYGRTRWDPMATASHLIECDIVTVAAIFHQWFTKDEFSAKHKPKTILNMWLTVPKFADEEKKVLDLYGLILRSNMAIVVDMMNTMAISFVETLLIKVTAPQMVPAFQQLTPEKVAYILFNLKQNNYGRFEFFTSKFPSEYSEKVYVRLKELEAGDSDLRGFRVVERKDDTAN